MVDVALFVSAVLFTIGVFGVLTRRNAIIIFMCVELMLNAVNLSIVAFGAHSPDGRGTAAIIAIMVMAVAAAEATVGLALVIAIIRTRQTPEVDEYSDLRE